MYYLCESEAKVKFAQSCPTLCEDIHGLYSPWDSPGQNTGVGSCSLLQGISPTQGSNPSLLYCRWILYQLNLQGNPGMESFIHSFCEESCKPVTVQYYIADCINWVPRLTLLDL